MTFGEMRSPRVAT